MNSSFQEYLSSINTEYNDDCYWGQHYDTETRTSINIKSVKKVLRPIKINILETIKEEKTYPYPYPEDIETGFYKNILKDNLELSLKKYSQNNQFQINYHQVAVMSTIYISHILLVILLFSI